VSGGQGYDRPVGRPNGSSDDVAGGDRDAREAFLTQARAYAPYLGVEADGSRFVVATQDRHMGKHLFMKQGRPEFRVLGRAVAILETLLGGEAVADQLFVDVGANIGTSTISALASQRFGSAVCCEPEEENYRLLRANLALNDLEERARTRRVAVSDRPGRSNLVVVGGPAGKSRIVPDPQRILDKKVGRAARRLEDPTVVLPEMTIAEVEVVTLDELANSGVIEMDRLGMVWIDAEGHEGHILSGASSLVDRGVPIVFEFHPVGLEANGTRGAAHEIAEGSYTHFVDVRRQEADQQRFGLQPVTQLRALADHFLNPANTASYTDVLLLRLDAAQVDLGQNLPELIAERRRQRAVADDSKTGEAQDQAPRRVHRGSRPEQGPSAQDRPRATADPLIAFVHIQRTAGATVRLILDGAYSSAAVRNSGDYFKSPETVAAKLAQLPKRGWDKWQRRGGRVVVGHVPYGLYREHLPPDTRYLTFLREPVDRVLSHYHGLIHGFPRDQGRPTADSLEEALVEMRLPQLNNLATRYLCGDPSPLKEMPAGALDDAKANLRDFAFVGIQERFEESIVLLRRMLGLSADPYLNRHVSIDRPDVEEISGEQRALITECNQLDAELYAFAQELFENAVAAADDEFSADVEALRAASGAPNEEAIRNARDWLDRELPAGTAKPKTELLAKANVARVPVATLKHVLNRLSVRKEPDDEGRVIWSRAHERSG
jgi:FkbM family methyltransferase